MAENNVLAQQYHMVDFKARHSGLSGLQGARYARAMKVSHPDLATEKSFSSAFSMMERLFEVNCNIEGKCVSRSCVTGSLRESGQDNVADEDFLPDSYDDLTGMASDCDPDEKPFCSSQPPAQVYTSKSSK